MTHHDIPDIQQRQQALNPHQSFIVQAPAGSGKTELLTQRFLALLVNVKQPEEILAITFTKKSSAEMRARIINALNRANHENEPAAEHAKATWQLARKVLERNNQLHWNLLDNPNRLRIQTIDSFNAYLTKQLPILAHFGATPDISDDPNALYQEAVREFLSHLEENVAWSNAIAQLLIHMDNDLNKVETLLIKMLAKRDQWLPYITLHSSEPELRKTLEIHLEAVVMDILSKITQHFPKQYTTELLSLADFAAANLTKEHSKVRITHCVNLIELPSHSPNNIDIWLGLSDLLLNKEYEWRKQYDKRLGFPAPTSAKTPQEKLAFQQIKQRMQELIAKLSEHDALRLALIELNTAPWLFYEERQWQTLEALHQALRIVVAQLNLVFQKHGKIDYIESAQAALLALGTDDMPTDLTLALDYQLQHILIDEFQDTSHSQFKLIQKLTAGWNNQDGRTLFVVGDPMQSIYRFREAEVGLFIRVRNHGLGHIRLQPLTLAVNFRSTPGIVNWVNHHFKQVLPPFEDIATGAVSYNPSIANQAHLESETLKPVELHAFIDSPEAAQAYAIVNLIKNLKQTQPEESIAILVRSRSHLQTIIPALKNANLSYRAIDIDPLDAKPVIQDLLALTRALLHPADRIAWLAILRAPWCGLMLEDLLVLSGDTPQITLYERLQSADVYAKFSHDAQQRLSRIMPILRAKMTDRYRYPMRTWIESTWLLLGGPACVMQTNDLEDAAAFFVLLETLDQTGSQLDIDVLTNKVSKLFAAANNQADHTLQIMTIHNAKGLEFDTVILPHLERRSPQDDKQLLLWMEQPLKNTQHALLIAPVHAIGQNPDAIYEYIKRQHRIKTDYENGRLLYVAATRTKKQLHLFFSLEKNSQQDISEPATSSLLAKLWPAILPPSITYYPTSTADINTHETRYLSRLALTWKNPIDESFEKISFHNQSSGFQLIDQTPKRIGTFIHTLLQHISQFGSQWWTNILPDQLTAYLKNNLLQQGILPTQIPAAIDTVILAVNNLLSDPRGQWILQPHEQAQNEWPLTTIIDNKVQKLIIDRTFIDEAGIRWIIDYKTTHTNNTGLETFLIEQNTKYSKKMLHYAQTICKIDPRPIKLGLYFPLIPAWYDWDFAF